MNNTGMDTMEVIFGQFNYEKAKEHAASLETTSLKVY